MENTQDIVDFDPVPTDEDTPELAINNTTGSVSVTFSGEYFPCIRGADDMKKLKPYQITLGFYQDDIDIYGATSLFKQGLKDDKSVYYSTFKQQYPDFVSLHTHYTQSGV